MCLYYFDLISLITAQTPLREVEQEIKLRCQYSTEKRKTDAFPPYLFF